MRRPPPNSRSWRARQATIPNCDPQTFRCEFELSAAHTPPVFTETTLGPCQRASGIVKGSVRPKSNRRRTFAARGRAQLSKGTSGDWIAACGEKLGELGARQVLAIN